MFTPTFEVERANVEAAVLHRPKDSRLLAAAYIAALLAAVSVWFLAIRAPLWVDETLSYWQIAGGFQQVWTRSILGNSFAAYAYILWLTNAIAGGREIVLRVPSVLAMLAATYIFYRCARELFSWDVALIATVMFVLPKGIAFAAIDVRPYGFALLFTNLTILMFLRWIKTSEMQYAAFFGMAAAGIFCFHYLFATILGALALYYLVSRGSVLLRNLGQIAVAVGCFALFLLPVLPRLRYIYETRAAHSFASAPQLMDVLQVLNPGKWQLILLAAALLLGAFARKLITTRRGMYDTLSLCAILGLFPIFFLYGISVNTSVHVFIPRYLLVAVPGMALLWAWLCCLIDSRMLRSVFCFAFVSLCVFQAYRSPMAYMHEASWKEALAFADQNVAEDRAPLLMCSPLVEADYQPMPAAAKESVLFAPLSYYKVEAAVVPLPRTLNQESMNDVAEFLQKAPPGRRFLMLVPWQSAGILDFLAYSSRDAFAPHLLGTFANIWVVEFVPRFDPR
jgi:hypothetical protein